MGQCAQGKLASVQKKSLERHKYFREFHLRSAFCALICHIDNFSRQSVLPCSHMHVVHRHQWVSICALPSVHIEGSHPCPRSPTQHVRAGSQHENYVVWVFWPTQSASTPASCVHGFVLPCTSFMLLTPPFPSSRGSLRFKLGNNRKGSFHWMEPVGFFSETGDIIRGGMPKLNKGILFKNSSGGRREVVKQLTTADNC